MNVSGIAKHLKIERDRVERQLSGLNAALSAFAGVYSGGKRTRKRSKISERKSEDCSRTKSTMEKA